MKRSVLDAVAAFPKAKGPVREIFDAYERGEITAEEAADKALRQTIGDDYRTARPRNRSNTRSTGKLSGEWPAFVDWLVSRGVRPDTAHQYARRLERGHPDNPDWVPERNRSQTLTALRYYREYRAESR